MFWKKKAVVQAVEKVPPHGDNPPGVIEMFFKRITSANLEELQGAILDDLIELGKQPASGRRFDIIAGRYFRREHELRLLALKRREFGDPTADMRAILNTTAVLLEDWAEILEEECPKLNRGTLIGQARRIRAILTKE